MKTRFSFSSTELALLLGLSFVVPALPAAAQAPISLGMCQSTAPGPAKFAQAMWKGAELVVQEVNAQGGVGGRRLQLVAVDIGKNDPALARQSIQKAISVDKIVSLLCWGSNVMLQNGPLFDENKVSAYTMSLSARVPQESKYVQQLELITTLVVRPVAEYVRQRLPNVRKVAVLYVDYEFGYEMLKSVEAEFGKRGAAIVAKASHPIAPPDLRAQLTNLMQAHPDAIYIANTGGGELVLSIRTARELGFKGLLLTHTSGNDPDVYSMKITERSFLFLTHMLLDDAPAALKKLSVSAHGYAGSGYDFAWINHAAMAALAKEGKSITGETALAKVRATGNVRTPATEYQFFPDGTTLRTVGVYEVRDSQPHLLQIYQPGELK
jgi:ABC-type branched-subunit amino acid transport system substrate-binding protein